jgi:hypothetical protein
MGAGQANGGSGGHIGVGHGDDLIAGPDSQSAKRQVQGRRPGVDAHGVARPAVGRERSLEFVDLAPQLEPAVLDHRAQRRVDLGGQPPILDSDIVKPEA